jgi:hypothetical protein
VVSENAEGICRCSVISILCSFATVMRNQQTLA